MDLENKLQGLELCFAAFSCWLALRIACLLFNSKGTLGLPGKGMQFHFFTVMHAS